MPRKPNNWLLTYEDWNKGESLLEFAIRVYRGRQAKDPSLREFPPWGLRTKNKVWLPFPGEVRSCCQEIFPPTLSYPWTYQRHCRSARHVAMLFGVKEQDILRAVQTPRIISRCCECNRFIKTDDYICPTCRENALDKQSV